MPRIALVPVLACVVACSSSSGAPGSTPDAAVGDAARCTPRGDDAPSDAICVGTVTATVTDEGGAPLADRPVTVCGDACVYGSTDASGRAVIPVDAFLRRPSWMLHGRSQYATFWVPLHGGGDVDLGTLVAHRMPDVKVDLPRAGEGGVVASGDVTLEIPSGAKVTVDVIELQTPDEQRFSATRVPLAAAPPWARGDPKLVALYALTPFATTIAPGAKVRIANDLGLPPGARVELWAHGADDRRSPVFAKACDAAVTADGLAIESDDATPLAQIGWIGLRGP